MLIWSLIYQILWVFLQILRQTFNYLDKTKKIKIQHCQVFGEKGLHP